MAEVVAAVEVFRLGDGRTQTVDRAPTSRFAYRRSDLPDGRRRDGATVALAPGRARRDPRARWTRPASGAARTQPLAEPNCGSVFKNPQGDHAARLIEAAG